MQAAAFSEFDMLAFMVQSSITCILILFAFSLLLTVSDTDFTRAFNEYLSQVRSFNPQQRQELLEQTQKTLNAVLSSAPKPDIAAITPVGVEDPVKFNRRECRPNAFSQLTHLQI